jgi:hypothetical protein
MSLLVLIISPDGAVTSQASVRSVDRPAPLADRTLQLTPLTPNLILLAVPTLLPSYNGHEIGQN